MIFLLDFWEILKSQFRNIATFFAMLKSFGVWQLEWTRIDKKVIGKHNCKEFIYIILKFSQTV